MPSRLCRFWRCDTAHRRRPIDPFALRSCRDTSFPGTFGLAERQTDLQHGNGGPFFNDTLLPHLQYRQKKILTANPKCRLVFQQWCGVWPVFDRQVFMAVYDPCYDTYLMNKLKLLGYGTIASSFYFLWVWLLVLFVMLYNIIQNQELGVVTEFTEDGGHTVLYSLLLGIALLVGGVYVLIRDRKSA